MFPCMVALYLCKFYYFKLSLLDVGILPMFPCMVTLYLCKFYYFKLSLLDVGIGVAVVTGSALTSSLVKF